MRNINRLFKTGLSFAVALIAIGCAKSPIDTSYQAKSKRVLQQFAGNVTRGFAGPSNQYRGTYGHHQQPQYEQVNSSYSTYYTAHSQNPYDLLNSAMEQEVEVCASLVENIPQNCDNYQFMVATLARCLDRIITYRNPLLNYAFKNLDNRGQQYWAYLLDRSAPQSFNLFVGNGGFQPLMNYASGIQYAGY